MLTLGATPFYGQGIYCTLRDEGYFIGLRFSERQIWCAELVRPKHLTNLKELKP